VQDPVHRKSIYRTQYIGIVYSGFNTWEEYMQYSVIIKSISRSQYMGRVYAGFST
jgi:hypothetical protein